MEGVGRWTVGGGNLKAKGWEGCKVGETMRCVVGKERGQESTRMQRKKRRKKGGVKKCPEKYSVRQSAQGDPQ